MIEIFREQQNLDVEQSIYDSCFNFSIQVAQPMNRYQFRQRNIDVCILPSYEGRQEHLNVLYSPPAARQNAQQWNNYYFYHDKMKNQGQTNAIMHNIESTNQKLRSRMTAIKGNRLQTQNTGKHMKTLVTNILKLLIGSNLFEKFQEVPVKKFMKSNGAINDFNQLFQNENLKQKCREFISSHISIQIIMKSSKLSISCKLLMVKYLEKLRKFTFEKQKSWKLKI